MATKFTGDETVAPSCGEHTTTPVAEGALQLGGAVVVVPVPVSEAVCGLPEAESMMLIAPVRVPAWVGEKVTLIEQLAPTAKLLGQLLVWAKSPLAAMLLNVSAAPPLLVTVIACPPLVVPTCRLLKIKLLGLSVTAAGVLPAVTVMLEPALNSTPLLSHTWVRMMCDPVATVTNVFTEFVFKAL